MINRKKIIISLLCMIGVFILLSVTVPKIVGVDNMSANSLDKYTSSVVLRKDGTRQEYASNTFDIINKGDQVLLKVTLPESLKKHDQVLMFSVYHCSVEVVFNNRVLYDFGKDLVEADKLIGNIVVRATIPDEAWGNEIEINLNCNENNAFTKIDGLTVLDGIDGFKYSLIDEPMIFVLFLSITVCGIAAFVAILVFGKWKRIYRYGIYISLFTIAISIWLICYNKMGYLVFANPRVCSDMEYIALLFCPIPLCLYCTEIEKGEIAKKIYIGFSVVFCGLFLSSTISNYAGGPHYNSFLTVYHCLMVLSAAGMLVLFFVDRGNLNLAKNLTDYGVMSVLLFGILDIIRYSIIKFIPGTKYMFRFSIVPIGIIALIYFLLTGLWEFIKDDKMDNSERQRLTKLAYTDLMTGLSNRADCDNKIKEIAENAITNYSIIFLDLNNLKTANDVHGHTMGDAYIIEVAKTIEKAFPNVFRGRYGGDEFLVVVEGRQQKYVNYYLSVFENTINNINESKTYPFKLGVPTGVAVSTKKNPLKINEAIEIADNDMYEKKIQMKKG